MRLLNLDNPHLKSGNSFGNHIPLKEQVNDDEIIDFYEQNICKDIDWKNINAEKLFTNETIEKVGKDDVKNDNKQDKLEIVTRDNIETKFAPFPDHYSVQTYATEANKEYTLTEEETNNSELIIFKCKSKKCDYKITFTYVNDGFHVTEQTKHTCKGPKIIKLNDLKQTIKKLGKQVVVDIDYYNLVRKELNADKETLNKLRIRRVYNDIFELNTNKRLKSWGKLESFLDIIRRNGGYGKVHRNKDNLVEFVGFTPNYAVDFINSVMFFPVVQIDTRFQTGIAGGHLYCMVTLSGNRTIIPLAAAWSPSERQDYTRMLLEMMGKELHNIKVCQTDESGALITPVEEVGIENQLCIFHMSLHCKDLHMLIKLASASDSHEFAETMKTISDEYDDLRKYLENKDHLKKVSRFASSGPRDQNLATAAVESLNAFVKRLHLKNKEPLEVFLHLYEFGFLAIQKICLQKSYFTTSVSEWLSYALAIAHNLTVIHTDLEWEKYDVSKDNDPDTNCTVILTSSNEASCTCLFYKDCGMPCIHLLAVACKKRINWCKWIHPRYYPSNYRKHFKNLTYPDFNQIIQKTDDLPVETKSLKQKSKRIPNPGEKKSKKK